MGRIKKEYVSLLIEKTKLEEIDQIITHPNNAFLDDRSKVIRYCIKMQLPNILKELEEKRN